MMDSGDGTKTPPKCSSVSSFGESFRWRKRAGGSIFNGVYTAYMTHPEFNLSWTGLFLKPNGTLINAEKRRLCFLSAQISVHLRPN